MPTGVFLSVDITLCITRDLFYFDWVEGKAFHFLVRPLCKNILRCTVTCKGCSLAWVADIHFSMMIYTTTRIATSIFVEII